MRDYHSLSWLLYESLQQGRFQKARETLDLIRPAVEATGAPRLKALLSDMRARYVVETRSYQELASATSFDTSGELFAIGMSAARRGDSRTAELARTELAKRAAREDGSGGRPLDVAVMEKELAALVAVAGGRAEEAVARMQEAVVLEGQLPPPLGLPRPLKPASELRGEILLELGRAQEAAAAFEQALTRAPNRSPALLGLARAAAARGDRESARAYYGRFLANWRSADPALPELGEARRY
jgi:tetratricopeptide (TPR) repeat protein